MANILITDLLEESAYLLRSLMRGRGHSVSIAISVAEAQAKLETGLFDTLVVDLCEPTSDNLGIIRSANDMLPGLPVVVLTTEKAQAKIQGVELFGKLFRPIKGARVNEVCDSAVRHALGLGVRRKCNRISVSIPVTFEFGGEIVSARITDLSDRGIAIDADEQHFSESYIQTIVERMATEKAKAILQPQKGQNFHASGRIAFVDRHRRFHGKMIGMVFEQLEEGAQAYVSSLLNPPEQTTAALAPTPSTGAPASSN